MSKRLRLRNIENEELRAWIFSFQKAQRLGKAWIPFPVLLGRMQNVPSNGH